MAGVSAAIVTSPRLVVVLGQGGHTTELLRLVDELGSGYEYHYLIGARDNLSADKIRLPGPVYRVPRPRHDPGKRPDLLRDPWLSALCLSSTLPVLRRVRPAAVVTSGPWIGVVSAVAARMLGIRVVFVETGCRVTSLSSTGKAMRVLADHYFVQWEPLLQRAPRAVYAGRLW
jgi:UDP-N-acetylglucosamine:LPS N-acetylglucosamine transferase